MAQAKVKKPVQRRCIGCMQYKEKNELFRFFRSDSGAVTIDDTFKSGGRGAYICKNTECLEKAFKRHSLDHSFKTRLKNEEYDNLLSQINIREDKND